MENYHQLLLSSNCEILIAFNKKTAADTRPACVSSVFVCMSSLLNSSSRPYSYVFDDCLKEGKHLPCTLSTTHPPTHAAL
jgi:hypothetical protein